MLGCQADTDSLSPSFSLLPPQLVLGLSIIDAFDSVELPSSAPRSILHSLPIALGFARLSLSPSSWSTSSPRSHPTSPSSPSPTSSSPPPWTSYSPHPSRLFSPSLKSLSTWPSTFSPSTWFHPQHRRRPQWCSPPRLSVRDMPRLRLTPSVSHS